MQVYPETGKQAKRLFDKFSNHVFTKDPMLINGDELVKSQISDDFAKSPRDQGLRIPRNEEYLSYAAMMRDEA